MRKHIIDLEKKSLEVEQKVREVEAKMREVEERIPRKVRFDILGPVVGLLILTVGLLSGIILVQQKQELGKKAAGSVYFKDGFENAFPGSDWVISGNGQATLANDLARSGLYSLKITSSGTLQAAVKDFGSDKTGSFVAYIYDENNDSSRGTVVSVSNTDTNKYAILSIPAEGNQYSYRILGNTYSSGIERSRGWHKFEFVVTTRGTYARIDGKPLIHLVPGSVDDTGVNPGLNGVRILSIGRSWLAGDSYFDDVSLND